MSDATDRTADRPRTGQAGADKAAAEETSAAARASRTFLVVVDETEELHVALRYACRRARGTGGRVALLYVIEPSEYQHWMAVGEIMREERRQEAEELLKTLSELVHKCSGQIPVLYVREGHRQDELLKLIDEEPSISILVLGAGIGKEGPGPLITYLVTKAAAKLRVPITIVPGNLTDDQIVALTPDAGPDPDPKQAG
ncbi:MAG: universal stress protein [Alphaproteobacteria bacterium]|nr:universal stress protein [Alphaproteobacteria bacterium]